MLSLMVKLSVVTLPLMTVLHLHRQLLAGLQQDTQRARLQGLLGRPLLMGTARAGWAREYDYIVVGAGSAGAVLANRLSEDPGASVLLLEAGGNENALSDIPIAYQLLQRSKLDWAYQTVGQRRACLGLRGQSSFWPRGRVLGGTSVLNVMLYTRGNPNDYERWPVGWRWPDVFPYFLKSENNRDYDIASNGFHSLDAGYLDVARAPYVSPLGRAFVESAHELGYPQLVDLNGPSQSGFAHPQTTNRNGARCSTSKAFLEPIYKRRANLHIVAHALVTRVLFSEHKRAIGVQFERFQLAQELVFARREIILSAGAINSPQLLMLSGVGPARELARLGIPLVADLPVGENLQDHIYPGGIHFEIDVPGSAASASASASTFGASEPKLRSKFKLAKFGQQFKAKKKGHQAKAAAVSLSQRSIFTLDNVLKYLTKGVGPLASTGVDGLAFVSTSFAGPEQLDWPDIEMHMVPADVVADGGRYLQQLAGLKSHLWHNYYKHYARTPSFSIDPVLLRPQSRGKLTLRSRNPHEHPLIDPRYLSHPADVRALVEAMRLAIDIGHSRAFRERFNARLFQLPVPGCEHLPFLADAYLECVARTLTWTIYHPVGTCKMVADAADPSGVVDAQLRVLGGVSGLRVVDASIMPHIVSDLIRFGAPEFMAQAADARGQRAREWPGPAIDADDQLPRQLQQQQQRRRRARRHAIAARNWTDGAAPNYYPKTTITEISGPSERHIALRSGAHAAADANATRAALTPRECALTASRKC